MRASVLRSPYLLHPDYDVPLPLSTHTGLSFLPTGTETIRPAILLGSVASGSGKPEVVFARAIGYGKLLTGLPNLEVRFSYNTPMYACSLLVVVLVYTYTHVLCMLYACLLPMRRRRTPCPCPAWHKGEEGVGRLA